MSEVLTNGIKVPNKGSRSWYDDMRGDLVKLDALIGSASSVTVNPMLTSGIEIASITVNGTSYSLYQQDGDIAVNIKPVTTNAELPILLSKSSEENTDTVDMSVGVTVNPSTHTVTASSFVGDLVGNATTATSATKATQDGDSNVITDTYATKSENALKANNADVVHKSGDETITGLKTFNSFLVKTGSGNWGNILVLKNTGTIKSTAPDNTTINNAIRFVSSDYNGSYSTTEAEITVQKLTTGDNCLTLAIGSNSNTSPSGMASLSLYSNKRASLDGAFTATTVNTSILNIPQNAIVLAFCSSAVNNGSTVAGTNLKVAKGGTGGAFTATTDTLTGTYRALNTVDGNGVGMFVKIA